MHVTQFTNAHYMGDKYLNNILNAHTNYQMHKLPAADRSATHYVTFDK